MKTTTLSFSLLFLIISRAAAQEPLLDSDGDEVVAGAEYYMVLIVASHLEGSGLDLIPGRFAQCPFDVNQLNSGSGMGRSLSFYPANTTAKIITTSSDLNIKFNLQSNDCRHYSPVWTVDNYDENSGTWFITTGGVIGNPGPRTLLNWFRFERDDHGGYRIVHCPSVCRPCGNLCYPVGFFPAPAPIRLAFAYNYFPVPQFSFVKASSVSKIKLLVKM